MVFGPGWRPECLRTWSACFNSPWELDGVRTRKAARENTPKGSFNSPWELDGVRTRAGSEITIYDVPHFNSPWELDGVRTNELLQTLMTVILFQFPVGIRWCSDKNEKVQRVRDLALSIPCGN